MDSSRNLSAVPAQARSRCHHLETRGSKPAVAPTQPAATAHSYSDDILALSAAAGRRTIH